MTRLVFDFPHPDPEGPDGPSRRRVFTDPVRVVRAERVEEVPDALREIEAATADGLHAAGYLAYEAAPAFDPAYRVRPGNRLPLLWFGLFEPADGNGVVHGGSAPSAAGAGSAGLSLDGWRLHPPRERFELAVEEIREAIAAGRTYQVNYTARFRGCVTGDAGDAYDRLRRAQGRGYHAHLDLGRFQIVSVSPELFFARRGGELVTRPMKGTRRRGRWQEEDRRLATELLESPKERAENHMIVDLLRNDIGRIAEFGSVRVPRLLEVERYRTVLQMTSTVTGRVGDGRPLSDVLTALFPCGSVTGAPKVSTMAMIAELEDSPREVYCGAIGFVEGGSGACTFSVPIRTLWIDRETGDAEYGVGSGVTWDSSPREEYAEVLAKAAILEAPPWPDFELVETLRAEGGRCIRLERHLERLRLSAEYFGFRHDVVAAREALVRSAAAVAAGGRARRLRLMLGRDGSVAVEDGPLPHPPGADGPGADPPPVALASRSIDSSDRFLYHKTTVREPYRVRRAAHPRAFDVLLHNERGEVTEFTRGNVVVELDGRVVTPPREAGLLAGCLRAELLDAGRIEEVPVRVEELGSATRVWSVNSLRGCVEVVLVPPGD